MSRNSLSFSVCAALAAAVAAPAPAHAQRHHHQNQSSGGGQSGDQSGGGSMDFGSGASGAAAQQPGSPSSCQESRVLQQGVKLYDAKDFYNASIQFDKILNGGADNCVADQQKAQFYMGETLYHLKYYAEALTYFSKITDSGASHLYYQRALPWLAALSEKLPDSSGVLDKVGVYGEADFDNGELHQVRDQLYLLLGRYDFQQGKIDDAIRLFELVAPQKPEMYIKAKFFEGVTYVRETNPDFKSAAKQFKEVLRTIYDREKQNLDKPDKWRPEDIEYADLANLQLARSFYSTGDYARAIKYYDKIPQESPDWLESLFEESWAMFLENAQSHALGNIQTLNAPYFDREFYPESLVLKSVIYFENCRFDRSNETIAEFRYLYSPIKKKLKEILDKYQDPADLYDYTTKIRRGTAGLADRIQRAAMSVLSDRVLKKNFTFVDELDAEGAMITRSPAEWKSTQVAGNILADLQVQESLAKAAAGQLAHDRIKGLIDNIADLENQATKVEIQTLEAQKGNIPNEVRQDLIGGGHDESVVDDEHDFWPFDGEYWKDELGYYRYHVENKCPRQPAR